MAQRRCLHSLTRHAVSFLSSNSTSSLTQTLKILPFRSNFISIRNLFASTSAGVFTNADSNWSTALWSHHHPRHFSSNSGDDTESEEDDGEEDGKDAVEDEEAEAAAIGYKVVGPLLPTEQVFKRYEPVFAVVQIGSHQFKVSNGDSIFTERLKFCDINDKLILNKVLMLGSSTQTIVGRPTVPEAVVNAVVEEHALDAKVIIFKKKRRKNYRRTKGHRQELTKLRITDIQGIEKPEMKVKPKPKRATVTNQEEKVAVAA